MKTTKFTIYSKSPVIEISSKDGVKQQLAIGINTGEIYRVIKFNEELLEDKEVEVYLNDYSLELIKDFETSIYGQTGQILKKKIEIQKMLMNGAGYITYMIQHEPLYKLEINRYYDLIAHTESIRREQYWRSEYNKANSIINVLKQMFLKPLSKYRNITIDGRISEYKRKNKIS